MTPNRQLDRSVSESWWRPDPVVDLNGQSSVTATVTPDADASAVPFWALMCFSFVLLIAPQEIFPVLAPLRIALLAAFVAIITYLLDRFRRRQSLTLLTREIWIGLDGRFDHPPQLVIRKIARLIVSAATERCQLPRLIPWLDLRLRPR